jgi:class 3 adenylate cyclase
MTTEQAIQGNETAARTTEAAILFVDVVSTTAMFAQAGDLATMEALKKFQGLANTLLYHEGHGMTVKWVGDHDGFLAAFADVASALGFAVKLQRHLSERPIVAVKLRREPSERPIDGREVHLKVSMGLHFGLIHLESTAAL